MARARAYAAGGAAVISVLCEPHWFAGSVDDLRAVRAAVSVPVLAKEFVVDPRQLDLLRAAGADLVLLLAVLHPATPPGAARGRRPRPRAWSRWWRRTTRASWTRRSRSDARLIGINNRDLRTLDVDPERAVRLRDAIPGDRLAIAESGVRDAGTVARWRATGLRRGARRRGADARRPTRGPRPRAFVAAGRDPVDLAAADRMPARQGLRRDRRGRDAGRGPRGRGRHRAQLRARHAARAHASRRAWSSPGSPAPPATRGRPEVVVVTADLPAARLAEVVAAVDPDAVQLSGDEPPSARRGGRPPGLEGAPRRARATTPSAVIADGPARTSRPGAAGILLDAAGGPHPGGTGIRVDTALAAAVAREVPITLAGGMSAGDRRPRPCSPSPRPASTPRPARRARASRASARARTRCASRCSSSAPATPAATGPTSPPGPTPVHAGLLEADAAGRWGKERDFGGRYVPETLMAALQQLGVRLRRASATTRGSGPSWTGSSAAIRRPPDRPLPRRPPRRGRRAWRRARQAVAAGRRAAADPGDPPLPQARGPRPHRRPQDQQRARPGAAHAAARQDAGSSRRPAPASTASPPPPPARSSASRASCSWARRTSAARPPTCSGCAPWARRSAA